MMRFLLPVWLAATAAPAQAPPPDTVRALEFRTGVAPETVTVGDRFRASVLVPAAPGSLVRFRSLAPGDSLQQTGPLVAGVAGDSAAAAAVYPLVGWVAGVPLQGAVEVEVVAPGASPRRYRVPLRLPVVRSVLPVNTAGLRPRAGRGVVALPPRAPVWPWVLGAVVLVAAVAATWLMRRRHRSAPRVDPREQALRELDRLAQHEQEPRALYTGATRVLRGYLATRDREWGEGWTTTELLGRLRVAQMPPQQWSALGALLAEADRAKFTGRSTAPAEAGRYVRDVRSWIEHHADGIGAAPTTEAA